ncbi:hypothetical protein [Ammoniphilus sp. YIM 78166]|nr:hypothetical protein [Ammoniphilus sp. YIM 78166]
MDKKHNNLAQPESGDWMVRNQSGKKSAIHTNDQKGIKLNPPKNS